jgi:DedD protein
VKERLTGAIILVALIVLLVPELLTGPIRSAPRAAAEASSAEEPPLRSYTIHLSEDAHAHGASPAASGPEQPAPLPAASAPNGTPDPAPATPQASAADQTEPPVQPAPLAVPPPAPAAARKPASAARHVATAPPASTSGAGDADGFYVQLGSFASRANAERLAQQVRERGFQVSVSQGASGRHLYRVRVGPAHDHPAAEQLAQKLRASGHSGTVVPK